MTITCKNCGVHFRGAYCYNCSQKAGTGRLKVSNVLHEFWHNFTHTDKGYMSLLKAMVLQPGVVIREYIEGKRKKYFSPYTFYLVTTALLIFITNLVYKYEDKLYKFNNEYGQYLNLHRNYIILCCMPFIAVFLKFIFFRRKYNYAEWVTFIVFTYGLINFFHIIIQLAYFPLIRYHNASHFEEYLSYFIFFYVLLRFIQPKKWWEVLQCLFITILIYFLVEWLAQLIALWQWGVPVEKLKLMIKNSF
ncbi:DUF3667 domain-containing protein [Ferruginibacter sp. HRS2-29]|uniref:DUF3667 domain-containing protein n=1 Tax=Ferruginibacter sp. HRS2-29 TaxID=2487334 RepID=UPI0020CFE5B0|nr:DUF3667 domain-containing protein [Ferruginibacter sp. HRS2-29]